MQKSRLCEKYNAMRHPKDPFYSKYTIKCFLSKFTRSGSSATGHRQVERSLRISKTVNFKVINEIKASDLVLRKKRTNVILHKRSYLLRTFYSYLRGRLTTFKMLQKALRNLWVPLELARSRRGKQVIFIPVPTRRNKKTIIARH